MYTVHLPIHFDHFIIYLLSSIIRDACSFSVKTSVLIHFVHSTHFYQERPGMIEYIYYVIINVLQCLELGPHGKLYKSMGTCPTPEEESPHGVQTPVAVAAAVDQTSRRLRQEPGGDGEVEGKRHKGE